ncbi:MAG TPA: hypothetical protein VME43_09075 [Bryobacteraceae bacterium]|nr:hypothetical protein [Bryobacteraceae bacterium]
MACPYFFPVAPDPDRSPAAHAMLPLGDAWSGLCHADPNAPWQPGAETLYPLCNIGYARTRCPRFPAGDGPDAVRFSIRAEEGPSLHLYYVVERDHLPFAHGALEYTRPEAELHPAPELAAVTPLARAYVSSYFRRRCEAPAR